jgi:hypothetical protein
MNDGLFYPCFAAGRARAVGRVRRPERLRENRAAQHARQYRDRRDANSPHCPTRYTTDASPVAFENSRRPVSRLSTFAVEYKGKPRLFG